MLLNWQPHMHLVKNVVNVPPLANYQRYCGGTHAIQLRGHPKARNWWNTRSGRSRTKSTPCEGNVVIPEANSLQTLMAIFCQYRSRLALERAMLRCKNLKLPWATPSSHPLLSRTTFKFLTLPMILSRFFATNSNCFKCSSGCGSCRNFTVFTKPSSNSSPMIRAASIS